jgi:hypothetical protein
MYKARITKWGLDKKTKEAEAWAMLRIKMQRNAVGKDSNFRVRGKPVTIEDVLRYFKRKGIVHPNATHQPSEASTPPAIDYWTPVTSPKPGLTANQVYEEEDMEREDGLPDFRGTEMNGISCTTTLVNIADNVDINVYINVDQTRQILFSSPEIQSFEISHSPLPPQNLLLSEKLFASIKAFYLGAFSNGLFKTDDQGYLRNVNEIRGSSLLNDFYDMCLTGADLMRSKSFVEGRRCFSKASGLVSHLFRRMDPRTLICIFDVLFRLITKRQNDVVKIFRSLTRDTAIMLFAEGHPWRQTFAQISSLDDSDFEIALAEAWRCACDTFATSLGQFHRDTLSCYTNFIAIVNDSNRAPQILRDLLIRGEQELGRFEDRVLDIRFNYAWALHTQGQNAEAIILSREVLLGSSMCIYGPTYPQLRTLDLICLCQCSMGHKYEAESTLKQAIKLAEANYGKFDSNVLFLKARLERWLREWGREVEAAAIKTDVDEILGPDDIELEDFNLQDF